jgi:CHASE1-domain containing sensor protein
VLRAVRRTSRRVAARLDRRFAPVLLLAAGLIGSAAGFVAVVHQEGRDFQSQFGTAAEYRVAAIRREVESRLALLRTSQAPVQSGHGADASMFHALLDGYREPRALAVEEGAVSAKAIEAVVRTAVERNRTLLSPVFRENSGPALAALAPSWDPYGAGAPPPWWCFRSPT